MFPSCFPFPLFLSAVALRRIGLLQIFCNKAIIASESVIPFLINGSRLSLARIFLKILVWTRVGVINTTYSPWIIVSFARASWKTLTFGGEISLEEICFSSKHKTLGYLKQLAPSEVGCGFLLSSRQRTSLVFVEPIFASVAVHPGVLLLSIGFSYFFRKTL